MYSQLLSSGSTTFVLISSLKRIYVYILIFIDIKDLDIVIEELILNHLDYSNWHQFGLHLGLYDPTLNTIKKDHGECKQCLIQCMSAWLREKDKVREKGGPSWSSLATALDTLGEKSIASYIKTKYCI